MEATNLSTRVARLLLVLIIMIAAMLLAYNAATPAKVQLGIHAPVKHGPEAAAAVSAMFAADGSCNKGPSIEMQNRYGNWMNLCFHDDGVSAWITTGRISDTSSREITAIPRDQMSKPVQYLRSVITRDGYVIKSEHGSVPGWFQSLINDLIESGLY